MKYETVQEYADRMRLNPETVRRMIKRNELKAEYRNKKWLILVEEEKEDTGLSEHRIRVEEKELTARALKADIEIMELKGQVIKAEEIEQKETLLLQAESEIVRKNAVLGQREEQLKERSKALDNRASKIGDLEKDRKALDARDIELTKREEELTNREAKIVDDGNKRQYELEKREARLKEKENSIEKRRKEVKTAENKLTKDTANFNAQVTEWAKANDRKKGKLAKLILNEGD